jgi:leucyl aminopeptidase
LRTSYAPTRRSCTTSWRAQMKFDMCGAASLFGALRAAALMKLPLNVLAIIPAAETCPMATRSSRTTS